MLALGVAPFEIITNAGKNRVGTTSEWYSAKSLKPLASDKFHETFRSNQSLFAKPAVFFFLKVQNLLCVPLKKFFAPNYQDNCCCVAAKGFGGSE